MNGAASYVLDLAPIPIGMAAFYIIRSIRPRGRRIRIETSSGRGNAVDCMAGKEAEDRCEKFIRDSLIVNGTFKGNGTSHRKPGFSELGILGTRDVGLLPELLARHRKGEIVLFIERDDGILRHLLRFGRVSGILASYEIGGKLHVEGDAWCDRE